MGERWLAPSHIRYTFTNASHVCAVTVRMLETQRKQQGLGPGEGKSGLAGPSTSQRTQHSRCRRQSARSEKGEREGCPQSGWTSDGTHSRLVPAQARSRMFSETPAPNSRTASGTLTRFCWGLWQNHQLAENAAMAFLLLGIHGPLVMLCCG